MANHKSAEKRAKQNIKKRANNRWKKTRMKSVLKAVRSAIEEKDKTKALSLFPKLQSLLGKLSKSPAMRNNTASRITGRVAARINQL